MNGSQVGMIWAQNNSGVIGRAGRIPWNVPEDMARFKEITSGHAVVMGRRTWDSLPGTFRPLPDRRNIVVTRQVDWHSDGAEVAGSVQQALELVAGTWVWVIGGGEIYSAAMPYATVLEVTTVNIDEREANDTSAPDFDETDWSATRGSWRTSRNRGIKYRFDRFERLTASATQ